LPTSELRIIEDKADLMLRSAAVSKRSSAKRLWQKAISRKRKKKRLDALGDDVRELAGWYLKALREAANEFSRDLGRTLMPTGPDDTGYLREQRTKFMNARLDKFQVRDWFEQALPQFAQKASLTSVFNELVDLVYEEIEAQADLRPLLAAHDQHRLASAIEVFGNVPGRAGFLASLIRNAREQQLLTLRSLSELQAAEVLGVSDRTIRRRKVDGRLTPTESGRVAIDDKFTLEYRRRNAPRSGPPFKPR
jgi:hypothetical protein